MRNVAYVHMLTLILFVKEEEGGTEMINIYIISINTGNHHCNTIDRCNAIAAKKPMQQKSEKSSNFFLHGFVLNLIILYCNQYYSKYRYTLFE